MVKGRRLRDKVLAKVSVCYESQVFHSSRVLREWGEERGVRDREEGCVGWAPLREL